MNTTAPISWAITAIGSDAVISAAEGFEHTAATVVSVVSVVSAVGGIRRVSSGAVQESADQLSWVIH